MNQVIKDKDYFKISINESGGATLTIQVDDKLFEPESPLIELLVETSYANAAGFLAET